MALTIKLDPAQLAEISKLSASMAKLSENLAKWQAREAEVIEQGFNDLILILRGGSPDDPQLQEAINKVRASREAIQGAIDRNKGDEHG